MTDSATLVILGATGNLASVKLIPSLYHLEVAGLLDEQIKIVCSGRQKHTPEEWIELVAESVRQHSRDKWSEEVFKRFSRRISYFAGDYAEQETFARLKQFLHE